MEQTSQSITATKRSDALPPPPKEHIASALGVSHVRVEWLAGDGSDRCYYRIESNELDRSLVLMQLSENDAAKLRDNEYDWLKVARLMSQHKLLVPQPVATLSDYAALIIEDYGDTMLESVVEAAWQDRRRNELKNYYEQCFRIIAAMLNIKPSTNEVWCQRAFDFEKFSWELKFFRREFLENALHIQLSAAQSEQFEKEVTAIALHLAAYSQYFTHRDFHCRNIMVSQQGLALIDFQDARLGAATYDLASLVFDNYVEFDQDFRRELLTNGKDIIAKNCSHISLARMNEELPAIILQRQLKAIGTYGYLTFNKKRGNYMRYVPTALATLAGDLVADERWPFLSNELLILLRKSLNNHAEK